MELPFGPARLQRNDNISPDTVISTTPVPELIVERILSPVLGNIEGLLEVSSDNMDPTIKKGFHIGLSRLPKKYFLYTGFIYYVIDSNYQCHITRIFSGQTDDDFLLVSDNKEKYPAVNLKQDQIKCICKAVAIIEKC